MSYVEILTAVIIIGIMMVPLTMSMTDNDLSTADSVTLEQAAAVASEDVCEEVTTNPAIVESRTEPDKTVGVFTVSRTVVNELITVNVKWRVAGKQREYTLYGAKVIGNYNS